MLYALAGVDCVDVAADVAVVAAARQGLTDAWALAQRWDVENGSLLSNSANWRGPHYLGRDLPWLMVSLNDSEDPHFRKAFFDPNQCPPDCSRPCETLCPTRAIQFAGDGPDGVTPNLCYGCGRCITICPVHNIVAQSHQARPEDFSAASLNAIDAVEIHTQAGRQQEFAALWQRLTPWRNQIKLVSISCPDDPQVEAYLWDLYRIMTPFEKPLIWQTDGRPMSGDLGKGTTHAAIRLAQKVLDAKLPGYVQLAGGTNHYTASKLRTLGLTQPWAANQSKNLANAAITPQPTIAGIAYGSYARALVMPILDALEPALVNLLSNGENDGSEASQRGSTSVVAPEDHSLVQSSPFCLSQKSDSISTIDSTSDLKAAIAQARQLVGALKDGGID